MKPLRVLLVFMCLAPPLSAMAAASLLLLPGEQKAQEYVCPPCPHVDDLFHA